MKNTSREYKRQVGVLQYILGKLEQELSQLIEPTELQADELVQHKGFYGTKERLYEIQRYGIEHKIEETKRKLRNKGVKL